MGLGSFPSPLRTASPNNFHTFKSCRGAVSHYKLPCKSNNWENLWDKRPWL